MQSASTSGPRNKTVEAGGLKLHYVEFGPQIRRPGYSSKNDANLLLLLHGSVGNARVWDPFAQAMTNAGYLGPIIALDLRGHGESEWANPPAYRCEDYVRDLEALIERLSPQPVILVAHSMAVYHSIRFAAGYPDRVAGLVLVDIEAKCRDEHAQLLRSAGCKPHPLFSSVEEAMERERRVFPFTTEENLRAFVASSLREVSAEKASHCGRGLTYKYDRASLAAFDDYDERDRLGQIRCPALVVYGKQSSLGRPDKMREMASLIQGARVVAIDRSGHLPQLDNPDGLANVVIEFLSRMA